jgi:dTDP-4-amino-4,6-dideoxygalactose transaminase
VEVAYKEVLDHVNGARYRRVSVTPPNRLETTNRDLLATVASFPGTRTIEELREVLRGITGRQHIYFAPSCRAAIAQILSLLPQREVVIPAYTCPVVKVAVEVAGKKVVYTDISRETLNATSREFEKEAKPGRVLVPTHLFGIPTDIEAICRLAKERDCVVIEDAAAAFGSQRVGCPLGTFGDFGVYSFERSKRVPSFRGAAIIVNNERLFDPAILSAHRVVATGNDMPLGELLRAMAYNIATTPWLYGRVAVPRLLRRYATLHGEPELAPRAVAINAPHYREEFHPYQAGLVLRAIKRIDVIRKHVQCLTDMYIDTFQKAAIDTFVPPDCDRGGLLRFPVAFREKKRVEVLRLALRKGLYLETNYERPLPAGDEQANFPIAVWAAKNIVLLPLYRALPLRDAERLAAQIAAIAEEKS